MVRRYYLNLNVHNTQVPSLTKYSRKWGRLLEQELFKFTTDICGVFKTRKQNFTSLVTPRSPTATLFSISTPQVTGGRISSTRDRAGVGISRSTKA